MTNRELDALVADKIMELKDIRTQEQGYHFDLVCGSNGLAGIASIVPYYSTDISAAWTVVEKMYKSGWDMCFELFKNEDDKPECKVGFARIEHQEISVLEFADTISQAICLAALKAIHKS